jgi:hypothetical protein
MLAPDSAYRGQKIPNTHLKYDVFVTPSIPVVTTDFAPGEHERPWPPISSTLIYGSRDAVVVDSFYQSGAGPGSGGLDCLHRKKPHNYLCNSRARRSLLRGERSFGTLPKSALCRRAQRDSSHEGANLTGDSGEVLGIAFPESAPEASCGCPATHDERYRPGRR